ncbi:MAG: hypothetical protein KGL18_21450 [Burkholderiales bacterium]|nr:hypothetical protein [Burkholderiales bacterium]MDE1926866.1 hypothetical protein [Burkholderiales bacterium]MDE2159929.1 hypothetical protein [Burkholderiales bacterium]MDE2505537.1 hypothetical protein [Burkholderiales bacterium]
MDRVVAARSPNSASVEPGASDAAELVGQLGSEVASQLSAALERVAALAETGRIDPAGLRALREEIQRARHAGIMGQQLARLAAGRIRVARERVDLSALLREALRLRRREIEAAAIEVRQQLCAATVVSDATLLFALVEALLDWSFAHAVSRIDLDLQIQGWPAQALLSCRYVHAPADRADAGSERALDTMALHLLQHTAAALGLTLTRQDGAGRAALTIAFPHTLTLAEMTPSEEAQAHNSQPLAGRHVVVLAARREVRALVRDALQPMSLMVDFVTTLEQARELLAEGLPHALVYEATLGGDRFERLRAELLAEEPTLAFIQIAEQGKAFEVLNRDGHQFASVGRDAIVESLPAALLFELSRH